MTTNWAQYSLDDIWVMVQRESPESAQITVDIWRRTVELCTEESAQILAALYKLAEHWPSTQPAAQAFLSRALYLVRGMEKLARDAAVNGNVVSAMAGEVVIAANKIENLRNAAARQQKQHDQQPAQTRNRQSPRSQSVPAWREELNWQARQVMFEAETKVYADSNQLVGYGQYKDPEPWPPVQTNEEPVSPPRVPGLPGWFGSGWTPGLASADPVSASDEPPDDDTVLAGSPQSSPTFPAGTGPSGAGWRDGGASLHAPTGAVLTPGGVVVSSPLGAGQGTRGSVPRAGLAGMPPMVPPPGNRGATGSTGAPMSAAGRRRPRRDDSWVIPSGGAAVLEPQPDPIEHDPGPNVIGMDR